ncbi:MAG: hypothetical protein E7612_08325 [Ruminococcaceae bacterium]|nr:hypothetical protein [Oscillospiraceae bacterium]
MKKIAAFIMLTVLLFSFISCGDEDYPPVESSDLESQVAMTIEYDGKKYDVKYELYRALFLNMRESVDGGDTSVWSGENKQEYIARIDELIKARIADIYSVLHIAKKIGIDPYSSEFDKTVSEFIKVSVNGGYYDGQKIEGFGGDYDKYLESLKEMNMNYSVQDLLLRYNVASIRVFEYYAGYMQGEFLEQTVQGKLEYTSEDVRNFYFSDDCARVLRAYLPKDYFSETRAAQIREKIIEKANYGDESVANYIIGVSSTAASDVINGEIIGRHNLDEIYYSELEKAAFELSYFSVSELLEVSSDYENGYVIIYKTNKTDEHFESCIDSVTSVYVQNEIGKIIDTAIDAMIDSIKITDFLSNLNRAAISIE